MTAPIQRTRHSTLPEGQGNFVGQFKHGDVQRDLWEFLLPYGHLRTEAIHGGGVLEGLRIEGSRNELGLKVSPGLALDSGGRLLSLSVSEGDDDLRVRLRPAPAEGGGTEGLASVTADGVDVDTTGLSGEQYVVVEWNETLVTSGGQAVFRLTPWLRVEASAVDPAHRWVVLAKVTLGNGAEQGRVKALDVGPRQTLASLRDGLTFTQPIAEIHRSVEPRRFSVEQIPTAGLRARADGGLDVAVWSGFPRRWETALSVDGDNGHVYIGIDPADAFGQLAVGGVIQAKNVSTEELFVNEVNAGKVFANELLVAQHPRTLPIIQAGSTDPAATPWQQGDDVNAISVVVDTSAARFNATPMYFTSLGGSFGHFLVTGINAICNPTPTSFTLIVQTPTLIPQQWTLSPGFARDKGWHVNWVGVLVP